MSLQRISVAFSTHTYHQRIHMFVVVSKSFHIAYVDVHPVTRLRSYVFCIIHPLLVPESHLLISGGPMLWLRFAQKPYDACIQQIIVLRRKHG